MGFRPVRSKRTEHTPWGCSYCSPMLGFLTRSTHFPNSDSPYQRIFDHCAGLIQVRPCALLPPSCVRLMRHPEHAYGPSPPCSTEVGQGPAASVSHFGSAPSLPRPLERLGAWPANQFERASRIVPAIHPLAANLTVGVVCLKGRCGEGLSIDGPAPALVVADKLSPASALGSLSQSGLCSMLSSFQFRQAL